MDDFDQVCRVCGCSELNACDPPCWWVSPGLCSACLGNEMKPETPRSPAAIAEQEETP